MTQERKDPKLKDRDKTFDVRKGNIEKYIYNKFWNLVSKLNNTESRIFATDLLPSLSTENLKHLSEILNLILSTRNPEKINT